jgi:hypothetical protein
MSLEEICLSVRHHFRQLGAYISEEYQPSARPELRADLERKCGWLVDEIRKRDHTVCRYHAELVELQRRLASYEKDCADLLKRARVYYRLGDRTIAWSYSLELEQLRQLIDHEKIRLKSHERTYRKQLSHVRHLKQRLAHVCDRLARR